MYPWLLTLWDQNISDGMTIISQNRSFELGFFSPGASRNRYVGIWYKNIPVKTVVWVANRSNPINGTSGLLMIDETGNLVLLNKNRETVWSTNVTKKALNPVIELLDSGNLVLREGNSEVYLWQSFDYPTDTLLPGMKLGIDLRTGLERNLTSWKSSDDPSPGDFVWKIHHTDNPETTFWSGSELYYRSGPWSGDSFTGLTQLHPDPIMAREFVNNQDEIYYMYDIKSLISRQVMNQSVSQRQHYNWDEASQSWKLYRYAPMDYCSIYNHCGPYGMCMINKMPICQCLRGFEPKSPSLPETSDGCVRIKPLNCSRGDAFIKFDNLNLPDTTHSWVNRSMNLKQCREKCLQNCSCMAYTNFDFRGRGSGCAIWFNDLVDMRPNSQGGQALYIRMSALERGDESQVKLVMIIVSSIAALLGVLAVSYYVHSRRNMKGRTRVGNRTDNNYQSREELDLPLFDLATIAMATNNFSHSNRLGEGGFGPVYKGTLVDGQEIAVKRLSRYSGQGLSEFKTEVVLIATLQHRNLVKLLGCCMKGEERMLVYEYMSNQSLDYFIFDQSRSKLLDWSNRFRIIRGIARGLLYLHEDSRLRIIHRDLKPSNILLDHNMNPKISDFGMAKTFGGDQTKGNTNRVVGTYGYMAPEYAADGLFSIKSDAFSFGVLLLEIISGRRSRGFYQDDDSLNLIGYAWRLWREGKWVELVDPWLQESWNSFEAMRCVHVGLLCVQHQADDRLDMAQVIQMLTSDMALPEPKQPGFYVEKGTGEPSSSSSGKLLDACSNNDLTISIVQPR